MMMLSVQDLLFQYRNRVIIRDLTLHVGKGEIVAVLGPNGAGKTTFLKCLDRILHPRSGSILLDGESMERLSDREVAKKTGYVPQHVEKNRTTAFDAVLLGRKPHITWDLTEQDLRIVDAVFHLLSMENLRLNYIDELSGGELQKVAIARALVQEPILLLLDEPTSSLDLKNQAEIMETISRVVKEHEITVIMTIHDLNQAIRYADRFLFLKNGSVYAYGDRGVVTEQVIEEIYGLPVLMGEIEGICCIVPGIRRSKER